MKLKLVKASQGLNWVKQGMQVCRRQPLNFIGLFGLVMSAAMLLITLPVLGPLLVVGAMPLMWLGFMLATRRVLLGERVTPVVMLEALKGADSPRRVLAQLGGAYVMATLIVMQLAQFMGPGADVLADIFESAKDVSELATNPLVQQDVMWRMLLTLPVSLLFWHTPALVLWARLPVGKALFFSAVATWRNLGAFAVFGLSWGAVVLALAIADWALLTLLPIPLLANVLAIAVGMWITASFYASLYFTVVDCFEAQEPSVTPTQA
jgi:hypothetical protein